MERTQTRAPTRLRVIDVQVYHWLDHLSGLLICCLLVFSPWAFGTTEDWSIAVMNIAGSCLGGMLAAKLAIRRFRDYRPHRWEKSADGWPTGLLAWLTALLLVYCLLSAVNARATWHPELSQLEYHRCLSWLPHSLDRDSTWRAFAKYFGLAASFWSTRDWLLGKTATEALMKGLAVPAQFPGARSPLPRRAERLLGVVMVSGTLLAIESIVQRELHFPKLLFLIQPRMHPTAVTQWGPFAYRANGAQYFNLLWPVCLGWWWSRGIEDNRSAIFKYGGLLGAALMAACPLIASSRGGAIIALGLLTVIAALFTSGLVSSGGSAGLVRRLRAGGAWPFIAYLVLVLSVGFGLGWKPLWLRLADWKTAYAEREEAYQFASQIAADYPVFGTGPGTYESVSDLYRPATGEFWPAQLHNDWLEIRITFGWLGSGMIYLALATVLLPGIWHCARGPDHGLVMLLNLALAGCLVHARWDFPFQVHSILFLFLVWCALLSALGHRRFSSSNLSQRSRPMQRQSSETQDCLARASSAVGGSAAAQ